MAGQVAGGSDCSGQCNGRSEGTCGNEVMHDEDEDDEGGARTPQTMVPMVDAGCNGVAGAVSSGKVPAAEEAGGAGARWRGAGGWRQCE